MKIISIINWKGGVGKTTLTHHIAACLQESALLNNVKERTGGSSYPSVLLIDLDPQCNLSISALGEDDFETKAYTDNIKTVKDLFESSLNGKLDSEDIGEYILEESVRSNDGHCYTKIDLIPSHPDLIYTDMNIATYSKPDFKSNLLSSSIYKFQIVDEIIKKLDKEYDFVLIDCPPNLNYITQNALYRSDYYLIPTILDKLSSYGILSITNKVDELNRIFSSAAKGYTPTKLIGIVANNVREWGGAPKQSQTNILSRLTSLFGGTVFSNYLTHGDGIPQASELAYPVFALESKNANAAKQSQAIREITKEFLTRL